MMHIYSKPHLESIVLFIIIILVTFVADLIQKKGGKLVTIKIIFVYLILIVYSSALIFGDLRFCICKECRNTPKIDMDIKLETTPNGIKYLRID